MERRRVLAVLALGALLLPACRPASPDPGSSPSSPPTPSVTAAPTPSIQPTASPEPGARLASGEAIPATCDEGVPAATDTLAFVANGAAWALGLEGTGLTCLFPVEDPGAFAWGPLGDRALLGHLEVRGLPGAPGRGPDPVVPGPASWGRPTGKSVVFVTNDRRRLEKLHLDGRALEDVTPVGRARYENVVYHPSGLAFAAVVLQAGEEAIWLSTNTGADPRRVVFTEVGTDFGAMAFTLDGRTLLYAAQHDDDHADLHEIDLTDTSVAPVRWSGPVGERILDIHPGEDPGRIGITLGTGCGDGVAMLVEDGEPDGTVLLPDEARPTRAVGWLDGGHVLVAAGGCEEPLDLFAVDAADGAASPLVLGVDAAATRLPAPTPAPPLPEASDIDGGFA
ncbi:MAG: hypothetical protein HY658_11510 [Actinobacteria bacterium]|nr:hypothetical protein [Actinomycetota bacterium]